MGANKSKIDSQHIISSLLSKQATVNHDINKFYTEWKRLNPKDTTDIFAMGPAFVLGDMQLCLIKVNLLYIIESDCTCHRVKLNSKEYHDICMIKK